MAVCGCISGTLSTCQIEITASAARRSPSGCQRITNLFLAMLVTFGPDPVRFWCLKAIRLTWTAT